MSALPADASGRCLVMGVLNMTPDSFSDGGRYFEPAPAIEHGLALHAAGADIVDVGGESTRPGASRIDADEELRRVVPVVTELAAAGATVSIDTMRAAVAERALSAGAALVNDVSGGLADPAMLPLLAQSGAPCVLMHWRGASTTMDRLTDYPNGVVADVVTELGNRLDAACSAGVDPSVVVLDPGLGFAKEAAHNWTLLAHLEDLSALGQPILVGASRKRFLGSLLADGEGIPRGLGQRDDATSAVSALAAAHGAWCVRVHDVVASLDAVRVAAAWTEARR